MYSNNIKLLALIFCLQFSFHLSQDSLVIGGPTISSVLTSESNYTITNNREKSFVIEIKHSNCLSPSLSVNQIPVVESWPSFQVYRYPEQGVHLLVRDASDLENSVILRLSPLSASCSFNVSAYFSRYSPLAPSSFPVHGNISTGTFEFFTFDLSRNESNVIEISFLPVEGLEPYLTFNRTFATQYNFDSSLKFDFSGYTKVIVLSPNDFGSLGLRNAFSQTYDYSLVMYTTPILWLGGGIPSLHVELEPRKYQVFRVIATSGLWYISINSANHPVQVSVREKTIPTPFSPDAIQDLTKGGSLLMNLTVSTEAPLFVTVYNIGSVHPVSYNIGLSKVPPEPVIPVSPNEEPTIADQKLGGGTIAGIIIACLIVIAAVAGVIWLVIKHGSNNGFTQLN
eukprot:TRINITY_DN2271_c0_g3_i1.p1 TRINITY_DN2271_c0_g3~~TRINITY_DN2271_c0_g3_i1.p1  ORF type:complete len:397 (-),score=48.00 TRINITY_DN2271_c0_g3_i1:12-1202(-)